MICAIFSNMSFFICRKGKIIKTGYFFSPISSIRTTARTQPMTQMPTLMMPMAIAHSTRTATYPHNIRPTQTVSTTIAESISVPSLPM